MSTDYTNLITSEHSDKPNFIATIELVANSIADITALAQGIPSLFDLDTAIGSQLDVVGQWVGFARDVGGVLLVGFFGFADDATALGFGELGNNSIGGRFVELNENTSTTATLGDPEYRLLLRAKILQNDWDGSLKELEGAITDVIQLPTQVIDPGTAVVMILPSAQVDPVLSQLLATYDLLPRAAGVLYKYAYPATIAQASWTVVGGATVSADGTDIKKTGGVGGTWDTSAYIASPSNIAFVTWTAVNVTGQLGGGLATNPSASPNFSTPTFAMFLKAGVLEIWESGILKVGGLGYVAGASFAIYYDGKAAVYVHNNTVIKTTVIASAALSPMFVFSNLNTEVNNIEYATGS